MKKDMCYQINIYRFFMAVSIAIYHFSGYYYTSVYENQMKGCFLFADLFFVLSGYLLMTSYNKHPDTKISQYVISKYKSLLVMIVIVVLVQRAYYLMLEVLFGNGFSGFIESYGWVYKSIPEMLFLREFIPLTNFVSPLWYVTVLIYGGAILLYIVQKCKKCPWWLAIVAILFYVVLIKGYGMLRTSSDYDNLLHISSSFLRGIPSLIVGMLSYQYLKPWIDKIQWNALRGWVARIVLIMGIVLVFELCARGFTGIIAPVLAAVLIPVEFATASPLWGEMTRRAGENQASPLRGEVTRRVREGLLYLGKLSLPIYFGHLIPMRAYSLVSKLLFSGSEPMAVAYIVFVVTVLVWATVLTWVTDRINGILYSGKIH